MARAAAATCAACPSLRKYHEDDLNGLCGLIVRWVGRKPITGWCGEPSKDTGNTCGCLVLSEALPGYDIDVLLTIDRREVPMMAAGKTTVLTEKCPQGKW